MESRSKNLAVHPKKQVSKSPKPSEVQRNPIKTNTTKTPKSVIQNLRRNSDAPKDILAMKMTPPTNLKNPKSLFEKVNLVDPHRKSSQINAGELELFIEEDQPKYIEVNGEHKVFAMSQAGLDLDGKEKTNQDRTILINKPFDLENTAVFGIADGHGTHGHFVSQYVKEELEKFITNKENYITKTEPNMTEDLFNSKLIRKDYLNIKKWLKNISEEVYNSKSFDSHFSGTTFNIVILSNNTIHCVNVGDSRSILVKMDSSQNFSVIPLSKDHKPEDPKESERILSKGGLIEACNDDPEGPKRVWVKGEKFPGMCISRTIGDEVLKKVGVSDEPDFVEKKVDNETAFIVSASDGIWEFLPNEEVMDIIKPYLFKGDIEEAAKELIKKATELWAEDTTERDDISCVIYFFKSFKKEEEEK